MVRSRIDKMIMRVMGNYSLAFTGAFVGMCCQDLLGHRLPADFDYFEYRER
jgi:xylan 1,4-beta-xylosidase